MSQAQNRTETPESRALKASLAMLAEAYSHTFTPEQLKIYHDGLIDLDIKKLQKLITKMIMTHDFFPKVSTIRREYQTMGRKILNEFETHTIIQKAISQHGIYHTEEALEQIRKNSPALYEIVKRLGWREICMSPESMLQQKLNKIHEFYKEAQKDGLSKNLSLQIETAKGQIKQEGLKLICENESETNTDVPQQKTNKQNNSCSLGEALKELEKINPKLCKHVSRVAASNLKLKKQEESL